MEVAFKRIHIRGLLSFWSIGGAVLLLSIWGGAFPQAAQAMPQDMAAGASQSYDESRTERLESRRSSAEHLPGWAEPQSGVPDYGAPSPDEGVSTNNHDPPGEPHPLPVDGGLSLLAAAGAGYALRKLRTEGEDE